MRVMKPDQKQKYSIEFFREDYCSGCAYDSDRCKDFCGDPEEAMRPMKPTVCTILANALVCTTKKIKSLVTHYKKKLNQNEHFRHYQKAN